VAFRDGPFDQLKVPLAWTAAVVVVVAIIASILLILADRRHDSDATTYSPVRAGFDAGAGPLNGLFAAPVRWAGGATDYVKGYFFAVSENRRLRAQVVELQPWRDQAIALKNVNARYEAMLGLRTEPPVAMATARSVSESRGPFVNARLLDAGTSKGVRIGNPVINEHGLVGRIVGTTGGVSRLLLLTDVASRTPVLIDRSDARAMLSGDGSGNPRLEFVRGVGTVEVGDRVLTSGDGGGYPRGVPIGVAAKGIDGSWRVKLFSDRGAIDYVRIMLFQDFGQMVAQDALNAAPLAGLAAPPTTARPEGFIQANRLVLTTSNVAAIQNSGTGAVFGGFSVGTGGLEVRAPDGTQPGSTPAQVVVYGRAQRAGGTFASSSDAASEASFAAGQQALFDRNSLVNGCAVGATCGSESSTIVTTVSAIEETLAATQAAIEVPAIRVVKIVDQADLAVKPIITEPVSGAGNASLWDTGSDEEDEDEDDADPSVPAATQGERAGQTR